MIAAQCRAARALLKLGVRELAEQSQTSTNTVVRLESGAALHARTVAAIRAALEAAGVEFLDAEDGRGPGVRLAVPQP
jgi:transcriptional regulator with XRE-family HTH domain